MGMFEPPFIGSEVIATGAIRKHELQFSAHRVPDVYVQKDAALTCPSQGRLALVSSAGRHRRTDSVTLRGAMGRRSRAHRADMAQRRSRPQVCGRTGTGSADEFSELDGMRVTTTARGIRHRSPKTLDACANLDALGNATALSAQQILLVARNHRGSRGLRQSPVLDLYDPGAASPELGAALGDSGGLPEPNLRYR